MEPPPTRGGGLGLSLPGGQPPAEAVLALPEPCASSSRSESCALKGTQRSLPSVTLR